MDASALLSTIGQLLALALVGLALRATGLLARSDARVLNAVIVYAALPALIFSRAYAAELAWSHAHVVAVAWVVCATSMAVAWLVARALALPRSTAASLVLVASVGNTGYIGYPVAQMLLGDEGLTRAIFYDVFGTVAVLFTLGVAVASRMGDHGEGPVDALRELLTFPAMVALLLALALRLVPIPQGVMSPVIEWTGLVGRMAVPLIMVSLGLSLSASGFRTSPAALGAAAVVKLAFAPAVAFAAATLFGLGEATSLVVLQASMPSMMLTLVVGERFGLDTGFIASALVVTTVACVATIPVAQLLAG